MTRNFKNFISVLCLLLQLMPLPALAARSANKLDLRGVRGIRKDPNRKLNNKKLVKTPTLKTVTIGDVDGSGEGSGDGQNGSSDGDHNSQNGSGSGNGSGGGSANFNEGQKNINPVDPGAKTGDDNKEAKNKNGSGDEGEGPEVGVDRTWWIPICFFFDPVYSEAEGRATVKEVVDAFGACDIAVEPHVTTLRLGTYSQDDPNNLNANSKAHCNVADYYGDSSIRGAGQTHPNSFEASDRMCDEDPIIQLKEEGKLPWDVGGCASMPGSDSIVDYGGGGGVATHELGHNVGNFGQGGSTLENENEKGVKRTSAGYGLQLTATPGVPATEVAIPEGSGGSGGGFNELGCASLRGGANPNEEKKLKWYPQSTAYYHKEEDPKNQLDFNGREKLYLPPKGKQPPAAGPQMMASRSKPDPQQQELSGRPPEQESPRIAEKTSGPDETAHKKKKAPPLDAKIAAMMDKASEGLSTKLSVKEVPDAPQEELTPQLPPPPGVLPPAVTYGFDEERKVAGTGAGSISPSELTPGGFASESETGGGGASVMYDEGAKAKGSIAAGDGVGGGRATESDRSPAGSYSSSEAVLGEDSGTGSSKESNKRRDMKKKKKSRDWRRPQGSGLRRNEGGTLRGGGSGDIYQSGSSSSFDNE